MSTQGCADPTFGVQPQAMAIVYLLAGRVPDFAEWDEGAGRFDVNLETYPWYNGREKAICLLVYRDDKKDCLHVTFGEDRQTDRLFVESWVAEYPPNGPTLEGTDPEAYEGAVREFFDCQEVGHVVEYIHTVFRGYCKEVDGLLDEGPASKTTSTTPTTKASE